MATIHIVNLVPIGFDLLSDSESFMKELSSETELSIQGGLPSSPACVIAAYGVGVALSGAALWGFEKGYKYAEGKGWK